LTLILASGSPRRREILTALGVEFTVVTPEVDELTEGEPERVVVENARRKARAGLARAPDGAVSLGADTEVVVEGRLLGKAGDAAEARGHLETLSGRTHEVLSGLVLLGPGAGTGRPPERSGVARSLVTFRDLDPATLELYLASGEWRGRAGAYAIQGLGSILAERLEGDLSNVVGLPVPLFVQLAPELLQNPKANVYP
jgi:septum formation protein